MIIIMVIGIAHFFVGSLMVALPFLAKSLEGSGVRNLGYLETMMGAGLILGSVLVSMGKKGEIRDFFLFLFLMSIGGCYLLVGVMKHMTVLSVIPYTVAMLFVGGAIANASIYWQSLLQINTPNEMAGRIFSISSMMGNISLPIAYGVFGLLLKFFSLAQLMAFSGMSLVILSVLLMFGYQGGKNQNKHLKDISDKTDL